MTERRTRNIGSCVDTRASGNFDPRSFSPSRSLSHKKMLKWMQTTEYRKNVKRTIKALEDWDKNDPGAR